MKVLITNLIKNLKDAFSVGISKLSKNTAQSGKSINDIKDDIHSVDNLKNYTN
jgi:hypothetical protein